MSLNIFSSRINHDDDDDDNGYLQGFCEQILKIDYFIRSAIIVDHLGHIIASASRPGLIQLMSHEESARAAVQAVIRSATRNKFKLKIGDLLFSISRYSREIRATIPVQENNDAKNKSLLLLTFDVDAEADFIILKKILPFYLITRILSLKPKALDQVPFLILLFLIQWLVDLDRSDFQYAFYVFNRLSHASHSG